MDHFTQTHEAYIGDGRAKGYDRIDYKDLVGSSCPTKSSPLEELMTSRLFFEGHEHSTLALFYETASVKKDLHGPLSPSHYQSTDINTFHFILFRRAQRFVAPENKVPHPLSSHISIACLSQNFVRPI